MIEITERDLLKKVNGAFHGECESLECVMSELEFLAERQIESCLNSLGIDNSRKSDKKSLPVHNSVSKTRPVTPKNFQLFQFNPLKREIVRTLLETRVTKIRFYVDATPVYGDNGMISGVTYTANWYEHN
jgi:hypothetical protein